MTNFFGCDFKFHSSPSVNAEREKLEEPITSMKASISLKQIFFSM
jgi:hypothetical protein